MPDKIYLRWFSELDEDGNKKKPILQIRQKCESWDSCPPKLDCDEWCEDWPSWDDVELVEEGED